jgi:transposase
MTSKYNRSPDDLSRKFEPTAQAIWNWVHQADRDEGRRHDGPISSEREDGILTALSS